MKVPYKWLKDFVDTDKDIVEVADALTLSGSNVEEVIETGKEITNVVTGKILKIEPHPMADSLVVCQLDVGSEQIQICTGATNMKENDMVAVAKHGSTLPGGVKIKKGKLRGLESNGMMCSVVELGVGEDADGLMILPQDTPIGIDIKEILGLNGGVIDFEITSNRADCFGVYGIAREAAATLGLKLKDVDTSYSEKGENVNDFLSVDIQDDLCRRYAAKMIKNVKIQPSPKWMQDKLEDAGVRPINNIVDITNYVMIELGQPMHAFDYRFIEDKKIIVKRAGDGEKFITLDETERELNSSMLTICDGKKALAIAGVMGGQNSEVKEDTNTIIFECANFDGTNVRLTSKKLGLRTDASGKFEKDLDPNTAQLAMDRACHLVEKLGAGDVVGGIIDVYKNPIKPHTVEVSVKWINDFLGTNITGDKMKEILESLYLKVTGNEVFSLEVPTYRQDIKINADVAEEVARIYGYNNIPNIRIVGETVEGVRTTEQILDDKVKDIMTSCGLYEAATYSFYSPKVFDKIGLSEDDVLRKVIKIQNPLGDDYSIMRTTAIPSIMDCMERNYARDNKEVGLFEIAKVFNEEGNELPHEKNNLIIAMMGNVDFYNLKGIIENLMKGIGIDKAEFVREAKNPSFHIGRCAKLLVRRKDAGVFGEIHPMVADNYGIEGRVYVAEIDLEVLYAAAKLDRKYKQLPKFPASTRDIAMLIADEIEVAQIENVIKRSGKELIESIKLFDVYKGKQIPDGMKSVAYSITYRDSNRTLKDEEVNRVHSNIVKALEEKLKAELR